MDPQGFPYLPVKVDVGGYGPGHRSDYKLLQLRLQWRKHISNMAPGAMPWPRFAKLYYLFVSWFLFESTPFKWFNMLYFRFFSPCIAGSECKQLNPAYFRIAAAIWASAGNYWCTCGQAGWAPEEAKDADRPKSTQSGVSNQAIEME